MECRKCRREIPVGSVFCNLCGAKQTVTQRKKASRRGNGEGSVYQLKNGKWCVSVVVGWVLDDHELVARPVRRSAIRNTKHARL